MARKATRDQQIFNSFHNGSSKEELAAKFGLSLERVRTIIITEGHRRALSPEPFYAHLRKLDSNPA